MRKVGMGKTDGVAPRIGHAFTDVVDIILLLLTIVKPLDVWDGDTVAYDCVHQGSAMLHKPNHKISV